MTHQLIVSKQLGTSGSIRLHCSCSPGQRIETGCRTIVTLDQLNEAADRHIREASQ